MAKYIKNTKRLMHLCADRKYLGALTVGRISECHGGGDGGENESLAMI